MATNYRQKKERGRRSRGTNKRESSQSWEFVGVDGEGSTDPKTGKAIFQILSAYGLPGPQQDKTTTNKEGLSTAECLEFLLSLRYRKKKLAICGFSFTYDICCMLRDITPEQQKALAKDEAIFLRIDRTHRYKIRVIYKKLLEIWKLEKVGRHWQGAGYVRVYDVFGFFQTSFIRTLEEWKIGDKAELELIKKNKDLRGENLEARWQEWIEYNLTECRLLRELMLRFAETLESVDIHLSNWWGAGSIASYWYRESNIKAHLVQEHQREEEISNDIFHAYFGGQTQTFYRGRFEGPVYHYDICSAYPWATSQLPSLIGEWRETSEYEEHERWALYQIEYDFSSVWEQTRYGPLPWRCKDQHIYYPKTGRGIFWSPEVEIVRRLWPQCIRIVRGRVYSPSDDVQPFSWVPGLFDKRNALKKAGDPRNIPLKLGLNSLYGKTAQGEGGKDSKGRAIPPAYQSYMWAGLITSQTRARVIEANGLNPLKVLGAATDGVFSREPLNLPNRGKGLGQWDEEDTLEWFELYGNGIYRGLETHHKLDENGNPIYLTRARGVENRSFDYEKFAELFKQDGIRATMTVSRNRFRGYKIAAHRNKPEQFATWGQEDSTFVALTLSAHEATEIGPNLYQVECTYRRNAGRCGEDRSFPSPYKPRISRYAINAPNQGLAYEQKMLDAEQP